MMHKCSNSQGNLAFGACSCGLYLFHSQRNSFSMPFPVPNHKCFDEAAMHRFTSSSSSSSVDCTLSLGTPSTRLCENNGGNKRFRHERQSGSPSVSSFRLEDKNIRYSQQSAKASRGSNGNIGNDALIARRCANCDTTSTPLWRNGPKGPKSLCNACGIRFKKEERRAANAGNSSGATASMVEQLQRQVYHHQNNPWVHHSQNQKMPCFSSPVNVFWFI